MDINIETTTDGLTEVKRFVESLGVIEQVYFGHNNIDIVYKNDDNKVVHVLFEDRYDMMTFISPLGGRIW